MTNADIFSVYSATRSNEDGGGGYSNAYYQNLRNNNQKNEKEKEDRREKNDTISFGESLDENITTPRIDKDLEKRIMELGARHQAKVDHIFFEKVLTAEVLNEVQRENARMTNPFIRKQIEGERARLQEEDKGTENEKSELPALSNNDLDFNVIYDKLLAEVYNKLWNDLYSKLYTNITDETGDEIDKIELRVRGMKKYIEMLETRIEELEFEIKKLSKNEKNS